MKIQPIMLCQKPNEGVPENINVLCKSAFSVADKTALKVFLAHEFLFSSYDNDCGYIPPRSVDLSWVTKLSAPGGVLALPGTILKTDPSRNTMNFTPVYINGVRILNIYKKTRGGRREPLPLPKLRSGIICPKGILTQLNNRDLTVINAKKLVDELDVFSAGVTVGMEICNDVGMMKHILMKSKSDKFCWPRIYIAISAGMTHANFYDSQRKKYCISVNPLTYKNSNYTVSYKVEDDSILMRAALHPNLTGLFLQCDGHRSVFAEKLKNAGKFKLILPKKIIKVGTLGSLQVFPPREIS